jgi:hypothetical protein
MSYILSCGHREDDDEKHYDVMTKEWSRENTKAVGFKTVCLFCHNQYAKHGVLLKTKEEAMEWLHGL